MFTGIIESMGQVTEVHRDGTNIHYRIASTLASELKPDQSVSHDGVCLTVTKVEEGAYWVTAIGETLDKTNLASWKTGTHINLERSMLMNGRLDGHIVQGHVDQVARITSIHEADGSWVLDVHHGPTGTGYLTVEKGSVCLNGISLTCFNSSPEGFTVAIIPYTFEHTNIRYLESGDLVNLEFDIIGKYVQRLMNPGG